MANTTISAPSPPDLRTEQKSDLQRLWSTLVRELVDVRLSSETNAKPVIKDHSYRFVLRLHAFFRAILRQALEEANHGQQQQQANPQTPTFLKETRASCLEPFARLVLTSSGEVILLEGRHVLSAHYEDFLSELNHFELKGGTPSNDFIRRESFGAFLYHMPEQALLAVGSSMALAVATLFRSKNTISSSEQNGPLERHLDSCQMIMRFHHVGPQVRMTDVRTGLAYKFLTVKGHVVKNRPKRLRVVTGDFSCAKCGATVTHSFTNGRYSVPTKCITQKCRSKKFSLLRPTARYINVQDMRLQEAQEESTSHAGRTPRQMEVEITNDLVDSCRPGDTVLVAGIVQAVNSAVAAGSTGKRALETSTYKLYLQAHSITTMSESSNEKQRGKKQQSSDGDGSNVVFTQQQLQNITQLAHADHRFFGMMERRAFPFDLLVRSLCPSIIGHDLVKAGILLCLLGGTPPSQSGADKGNTIRCNSHILIVGDPGMGKSQMLLAATQVAARSVYVGGNTASTTGLTVSMTKEPGGEAGIEAGALVLADQGICCIDEFDKMGKMQHDGLLEAMEQQQISIAKAGVVASLPARCSVVAAANPKHGSYSMGKTVAENLNMATPVLSRFDLVFILRDTADKDQDKLVSSNIMNLYRGKQTQSEHAPKPAEDQNEAVKLESNSENRMFLKERLAWVTDFQKQPLPADIVRDYIAYAREYCKPKLTQEAAAVLKDHFMNLRYVYL